jgi:hypothetical protein
MVRRLAQDVGGNGIRVDVCSLEQSRISYSERTASNEGSLNMKLKHVFVGVADLNTGRMIYGCMVGIGAGTL